MNCTSRDGGSNASVQLPRESITSCNDGTLITGPRPSFPRGSPLLRERLTDYLIVRILECIGCIRIGLLAPFAVPNDAARSRGIGSSNVTRKGNITLTRMLLGIRCVVSAG